MTSCIEACDYDDYATTLSERTVRARKDHRCGECGESIQPGRLYLREVIVVYGTVSTHKTCARCWQVRRDYFRSWTYTEMVEAFREAHGFDYRDGIPKDFAPCRADGGGKETT